MDEGQVNRRARWLFALAMLAVFAAGGAWLLMSSAGYTTYEIETRDAVSGLVADAPVEFHGVEVGRVKRVALAGPSTISILLDVKKDAPVTSATVATITARGLAMRGFTGYVYIALEDSGAGGAPVAVAPGRRHPVLPAAPSQIVNLDLAISQVNENVQALTGLVQALLDHDTVASLKGSAASLEPVARTLAQNHAGLESLIASGARAGAQMPAFMGASRETLARVDALLDPRTIGALQHLAGSLERVTGMLADNDAKLDRLIDRGDEATRELAPLVESVRDTVKQLQLQVLPEAQRTLSHLDDLSKALAGTALEVRRDPSVLIRGVRAPAPGPGEAP